MLCKDSLSAQNAVLYRLNITTVRTVEYLMDACIGKKKKNSTLIEYHFFT